MLHEEPLPKNAFLFQSKPYNVPAVFQIWVCRPEKRELWNEETTHPDFEFTTPDRATFAIQRVGARAGRVHRDFARSPSSHHFIRGDSRAEAVMRQLDFTSVAGDTAGCPSVSKSEIVSMYSNWIEAQACLSRAVP